MMFPHCHSRQVRRCRALIWNPEICVSEANALVDTTRISRTFGAKYLWFPDRRAAGAALVRNDGAFQPFVIPDCRVCGKTGIQCTPWSVMAAIRWNKWFLHSGPPLRFSRNDKLIDRRSSHEIQLGLTRTAGVRTGAHARSCSFVLGKSHLGKRSLFPQVFISSPVLPKLSGMARVETTCTRS